jgi:hypothetical protein
MGLCAGEWSRHLVVRGGMPVRLSGRKIPALPGYCRFLMVHVA